MYETKLDNGSTVLGLFATPVYTTNIPPELSVEGNRLKDATNIEATYGSFDLIK